jgi:hypothetical protein
MFRPHTAIISCYRILSSRSCCSVMPIFSYVMLPAMCFSWCYAYCQLSVCKLCNSGGEYSITTDDGRVRPKHVLIQFKKWMCYIDGQKNKYSVYVCMYVCMYVRTYVCMHVCMYACMYACMHVCMYACMHVCMHVPMALGGTCRSKRPTDPRIQASRGITALQRSGPVRWLLTDRDYVPSVSALIKASCHGTADCQLLCKSPRAASAVIQIRHVHLWYNYPPKQNSIDIIKIALFTKQRRCIRVDVAGCL